MAPSPLTTGDCAEALNALSEIEAYTSDFIRGEIVDGRFPIARSVYLRGGRSRAFIRIHPLDFRDYIVQQHAHLLTAYDEDASVPREIAS